ncbi:MAG: YfcE family phosphodiesterase [Nitrososphaeria archaeon]|nr:YfcE family phosphodiesterase [Nitrososphaeria archaeon]
MLIGMVADTHDNLPVVDMAVEELNRRKVELVLHAGDYVAPFVIPRLAGLKAKLIGVFGNNDGDCELLRQKFRERERLEVRGYFARVSVDGMEIGLLHGHQDELLKALIDHESFDIVVHGHSHEAETLRKGKTMVVNPGELCGYLTGKSTFTVVDTDQMEAELIEL